MAKRAQQGSGEERVTAKSRPMMNLTARTPSFVSSSASSNPGRTSYGYQDPENSVANDDRTGKPVETPRLDYTQEDYGLSWSSQEWKSGAGERDRSGKLEENSWDSLQEVDPHREEHLLGRTAHSARTEETIHERTGKPDSEDAQGKAHFEIFIIGSEVTEFVNKVRDQVRIRQKRMSSIAENCTEHSIIWGMFMATTLNAATFMGKNYSTMRNVLQNEKRITLKQMFEISAATINNDEEIYCLDKIAYQKNSWTQLSLINDPVFILLQSTKVYVFSDSVLCLGKVLQHPECNEAWKDQVAGVRAEKNYSDFDDVKGESAEFEWNIFPGFTTLQLCDKISDLLSSLGQTPESFTGRILFMSMFNDIFCDRYDNKVKAEVPVHDEDPRDDQIILQQYIQQIESLSPENKLSKFCKEAGFMRVVEVGQYFVTRDAGEFKQLQSVACREYTLPRDDQASQPKGWIRGNMLIGLVLEVTTSFQHFKYGIEIGIQSVNQDDSHSWVRISYGTVKYVNDSIEDDTENLADSQEEESVPTSSSVVAARSKAKAKPHPRESTGMTTIPLRERKWIDIEPSKQNLESYDLSKKVINLLRHNQKLHREEDGAIQFYKIKFHLRDHHSQIQNWSDDRWKACLAAGGGSKRRYQYCSDNLGSNIYLRALQGHSGSNLIDPALQDNVLIGPGILPYIYHVGSNFNLHSIVRNGLVPGGQNLSRRQTVFFLLVDPRNEDHKDPEYIDYSAPRLARYLQNAWKRHQDAVFWVDIDLGIKEGLMFYQTRSNAIILQGTLPAHCIVRVERLKNGEKLCEKQHLSPRPPPKISLKHDLNWSKGNNQGSAVEHRPVGKFVQQSLGETLQSGSSKPTQFPKPIEDRTGLTCDPRDCW